VGFSSRTALAYMVLASVLIGGGLSHFASSKPDGLEWSVEKTKEISERN
jgi:hypothetical protein